MARLNSSNKDGQQVSLFPMFNILVCTMGSLILIVGSVIAFAVGPGRSVLIEFERSEIGGSHNKIPIYIEWDGREVTIHPAKEIISFEINIEKFNSLEEFYKDLDTKIKGSSFERLLRNVYENRKGKYLVVIVRPSGFSNFIIFRNYILEKGVDIGYEPLEQNWTFKVK